MVFALSKCPQDGIHGETGLLLGTGEWGQQFAMWTLSLIPPASVEDSSIKFQTVPLAPHCFGPLTERSHDLPSRLVGAIHDGFHNGANLRICQLLFPQLSRVPNFHPGLVFYLLLVLPPLLDSNRDKSWLERLQVLC